MDNRYYCQDCPALMQDGRFITNYTPRRTFEQYIRSINNINSSQDYKLFLQKNAENIMNNERKFLKENNTCSVNGRCAPVCTPQNKTVENFSGCSRPVKTEHSEGFRNAPYCNGTRQQVRQSEGFQNNSSCGVCN
jgi:hypothetical protein